MTTNQISSHFYNPRCMAAYIVGIPLFFMFFSVVYTPTFGTERIHLFTTPHELAFCISILTAIAFGVVLVSRVGFFFSTRNLRFTPLQFFIWQVCEFVVISMFANLFLSLYGHTPFFESLPKVFLYGVMILIYPYFIIWLLVGKHGAEHDLDKANMQIAELKLGLERNEAGAVKFADEKGQVRLVVSADKVVYLESSNNYVDIVYEDAGKLIRFALRNTLKGIEDVCVANDLVRCHRSYFINLRKVKLLRKDAEGVFAEMETEGVNDIPISKTYATEVTRLFSLK